MSRAKSFTRRRVTILAMIFLSVALVALDGMTAIGSRSRAAAAYLFAPMQSLSQEMAAMVVVDQQGDPNRPETPADLQNRVVDLQALVAQQTAKIDLLQRQVRDMRQIRGGLPDYPLVLVPATVLSQPYVSDAVIKLNVGQKSGVKSRQLVLYRYISQGRASGLKPGQAVVTATGIAGLVSQSGQGASTVNLVTHPDCTLPARVIHWDERGRRWVAGVRGGQTCGSPDGRSIRLQHVPIGAEVAPGDFVVTDTVGTGLPDNLIIGQVAEVSYRPADLAYTIVVRPRVDLDKLDLVYCLAVRDAPAK